MVTPVPLNVRSQRIQRIEHCTTVAQRRISAEHQHLEHEPYTRFRSLRQLSSSKPLPTHVKSLRCSSSSIQFNSTSLRWLKNHFNSAFNHAYKSGATSQPKCMPAARFLHTFFQQTSRSLRHVDLHSEPCPQHYQTFSIDLAPLLPAAALSLLVAIRRFGPHEDMRQEEGQYVRSPGGRDLAQSRLVSSPTHIGLRVAVSFSLQHQFGL